MREKRNCDPIILCQYESLNMEDFVLATYLMSAETTDVDVNRRCGCETDDGTMRVRTPAAGLHPGMVLTVMSDLDSDTLLGPVRACMPVSMRFCGPPKHGN